MIGEGDTLDHRYRLDRLIGRGGMGAVFEAEHVILEKRVAVKILHPNMAGNVEALERFYREARTASKLGHEGIVEISDVGQAQDGSPYLVMELLRGEGLGDLLDRAGKLDPRFALDVTAQILSVLVAVHEHGIVHRDLKPENIFLCPRTDGTYHVKILDFGICKITSDETGPRLTHTGVAMGTPCYMSPEQARGDMRLDHRTDLWSAGVMLYEMLTGRVPYDGPNYNVVIAKLLTEDYVPPRAIDPELPEELERVVLRALSRDPLGRYSSAAELLSDVVAIRDVVRTQLPRDTDPTRTAIDTEAPMPPIDSRPEAVGEDQGDTFAAGTTQTRVHEARGRSRRGIVVAAVVAVVLLGGVVGVVALVVSRSTTHGSVEHVTVSGPPVGVTPPENLISVTPDPVPVPVVEVRPAPVNARDAGVRPEPEVHSPAPEPVPPPPNEPVRTKRPPREPVRPEPPNQPPPTTDRAALTRGEIDQALSRLEPQVQRCLAQGGSPPREVRVRVRVDGQGRASLVSAIPAPWASAAVCLRRLIGTARFPATGGDSVDVSHSFRGRGLMESPFTQGQ